VATSQALTIFMRHPPAEPTPCRSLGVARSKSGRLSGGLQFLELVTETQEKLPSLRLGDAEVNRL